MVESSDPNDSVEKDPILSYMEEFTIRTLRLTSQKWSRMLGVDAQRILLTSFLTSNYPQVHDWLSQCSNQYLLAYNICDFSNVPSFLFQELVISQNFSGHLVAHTEWPAALKNKGVYFIKRDMKPLPKENFLNVMTCGDIHPNALDHFCAWVEEVSIT